MAPKPALLPHKRPFPENSQGKQGKLPLLSGPELAVYEAIKSKKDMGIWTADIRTETGITENPVNKAIKSLLSKQLIKDVVNLRSKNRRKMYMAVEFEPAKEISGGAWYSEGSLDTELVEVLRKQCGAFIEQKIIASVEMISNFIQESNIFKMELGTQQITEILAFMVLNKDIEECRSTGVGDFSSVQQGRICYRSLKGKEKQMVGIFTSIPCGVCPRINECSPDGIISPNTCDYYNKWLNLDF